MENFQENKVFGDVFCRDLKTKFGWDYTVIDPQTTCKPNDYPDIDIILISAEKEPLYLQLKQSIKFEECHYMMTKSWIKSFEILPFENAVRKAEENYIKNGKNVKNIILVLHMGIRNGYLILEDTQSIKKENFKNSTFRGIYIISPEFNQVLQREEKKVLKEFVFEIKKAF